MAVRGTHVAMAALAAVSFGTAKAQDIGETVVSPVLTAKSKVYLRGDFDLTVETDVYPYRAINEEVQGQSVVLCQVGAGGEVAQCVVESESPAGYGFGKAHAMVIMKYSRADTSMHPEGTWIRNRHNWTLN